MIKYEYLQETSESIADDNWKMLLDKHGSHGWELSSIIHQEISNMSDDITADIKEGMKTSQTLYIIIFRRGY